eukprot:TRINITY_DN963_c0_g1_i2.p1 TRINITY_DN963_c0_g1~~TRINITY_DN963_c0_g1_i2.p1  ORF type:complete len:707 (-),score=219.16 TRINITY_DN963_c0_g1_i2:71-2131(-)
MKCTLAKVAGAASIVLAAAEASEIAENSGVTPVQKVVVLLQDMLAKGKSEKHEEQVQFAAYKQFCDDTSVEKTRAIKEGEQAIEMLQADIQKHTADAAQLGKEIAQHEADIATWDGDRKAASKVREIEKADYDATHKDYTESVDALQRAIAVLKKQAYDRAQKPSLVEVSALKSLTLIPREAKRVLDTYLLQQEEEPAGLGVSAPEANAYEFQSHGVIEMLEKLLDKFVEERTTLEKEEANMRHAFEMLVQDLTAQTDQAKQDKSSKAGMKAKTLQSKATAEGDLTDTSTTRDEDKKYLSDLTSTCQMKASDFESRQQLRAEELEAIDKAIEILSGSAVSGAAEKHLPSLMAVSSKHGGVAAVLAQLRGQGQSPAQERVVEFLRDQGAHLHSKVLSALAVRASEDPFQKVKKMIKDLIVRLMEEANEEAEHKGWCDTELSTNEQTRKEKTDAVETLHAEIDELEASVSKLTEDLSELAKAIAKLDSDMAESTKMRQEEKATNAATIKDAQEAQTAVAQALVVLKEFYAKSAEATALVQQDKRSGQPAIFDSPYTGMAAESGGVVGMLEVIQSDFARLETETEAAEASAQKSYDQFMTDSKVDKAAKNKDTEHKTAKKQDQTQALTVKRSDLEGTQKELDAALSYYDKLKPSCVDAGTSYEDRVSRRKEEIESLQEALRILNGEDIA